MYVSAEMAGIRHLAEMSSITQLKQKNKALMLSKLRLGMPQFMTFKRLDPKVRLNI